MLRDIGSQTERGLRRGQRVVLDLCLVVDLVPLCRLLGLLKRETRRIPPFRGLFSRQTHLGYEARSKCEAKAGKSQGSCHTALLEMPGWVCVFQPHQPHNCKTASKIPNDARSACLTWSPKCTCTVFELFLIHLLSGTLGHCVCVVQGAEDLEWVCVALQNHHSGMIIEATCL